MRSLAAGCRGAAFVLLLWAGCGLSTRPCAGQGTPARNHDLLVAGGTAALLKAAGVTVPVEADRALLVLVRQLHGPFTPLGGLRPGDQVRSALERAGLEGREAERVPGLLPLAVWREAVFEAATEADLAGRILADGRASLLYYGLFALDDETVAFFAAHPGLVRSLHRQSAAQFAAYADGVRVRAGRVQVPGGTFDAWESALGVPAADPVRFLARLFEQDGGRLAALFDALGRLDAPHLSFAVGPSGARLPALIGSARRFDPVAALPFVWWSDVDVRFLLECVQVAAGGRLAPPRGAWFWNAVFNGEKAAGPVVPGELDSAALVEMFAATPRELRRPRLNALLFAQRRFAAHLATGERGVGDENDWLEPAAGFASTETLLLTLERMGVVDPVDYRAAVTAARAVGRGADPPTVSRRLAIFQSLVALIARAERVGTIGRSVAHALVSDTFRAAAASAPDVAVLAWMERVRTFLDRLPAEASVSLEGRLLDALAGVGVPRARPAIEWEGRRYFVDPAAAERARLAEVRAMQGSWTIDAALSLGRAVTELLDRQASPERLRAAGADILAAAGSTRDGATESLFGFRTDGLRDQMLKAARGALDDRARPRGDGEQQRLVAGVEAVLAETLAELVYALALDPSVTILPGDSPGRRHDFGLVQGAGGRLGPWSVPMVGDTGPSLGVRGSLLCLDRCLARHGLRSTMVGLPPRPPTLRTEEARGLAESVVTLDPFRLTDEGAALLAAAAARGRARLEVATGRPDVLEALLAGAGVDGIRRRLARLAVPRGAPAVLEQVSLVEVLTLGRQEGPPVPDAVLRDWGVAARLVDGSLGQWMPTRLGWRERAGRPGLGLLAAHVADLHVRVAEQLAELRLPAMLAPAVLSLGTWDLVMGVQVVNGDDWLPVVRSAQSLSRERFEDFVAALSARGPLVRAEGGK